MTLINDIFNIKQPQRDPQSGDLLVVEPFLTEAHFRRAVILLVDHNDSEGTVGLVLNRRSNISLNSVLRNASCPTHIPLHIGGPVEHGRLLYIHTLGNRFREAIPLENGLYIGGNFADVVKYLNSDEYDERCIKFFAGYCGWTPGQLKKEIEEKTWAVTSLNDTLAAMVAQDDYYWQEIVATLGKEFRAWLLCPNEPHLN
ncbi:MAG: YqgE/AlgH family protein [Bacteroidaceae bacterium]|nr:YqgE/AlgH family protein [Bacteroidaceae bacterium]